MKIKENIAKYIPKLGADLAKYSGKQLIDRVGQEIVQNVVASILCGGNVRSLTENLTQRRIFLSNASLLVTFLKASKYIPDFEKNAINLIYNELESEKLNREQKIFLQWLIGLTGKSIQNVLRSDGEMMRQYLEETENAIWSAAQQSKDEFGALQLNFKTDKEDFQLNWPGIIHLFFGVGAQTLAIRGSEKSMYGKLFEKLILGSLLTVLGFKRIEPNTSIQSKMVFWLSQRENKRESDATILLKPGQGVRFDIGFIGPGNSEISLDKVSRFEREMEFGRSRHFMSTIVLVDRIGEGSRIKDLAKAIEGNIVQMSMTFWVKEVAEILKNTTGFRHKILKMSNEESLDYIRDEMTNIDLRQFV